MSQHIAVVVGSLRQASFNQQLARALVKLAPAGVTFDFLRIDDLPLYNQDADGHPAPAVTRLKTAIAAAQGVIFVTPEYNRSIPGVLKNAIWPLGRTGRARGRASRRGCSASRSGRSAPRARSSISARFWGIWTCRPSASQKCSSP